MALPPEIISQIVDNISSRRDISSLLLTSRSIHAAAERLLYRDVQFDEDGVRWPLLSNPGDRSRVGRFITTLTMTSTINLSIQSAILLRPVLENASGLKRLTLEPHIPFMALEPLLGDPIKLPFQLDSFQTTITGYQLLVDFLYTQWGLRELSWLPTNVVLGVFPCRPTHKLSPVVDGTPRTRQCADKCLPLLEIFVCNHHSISFLSGRSTSPKRVSYVSQLQPDMGTDPTKITSFPFVRVLVVYNGLEQMAIPGKLPPAGLHNVFPNLIYLGSRNVLKNTNLPALFGTYPHLDRLQLFVPGVKCSEARLIRIADQLIPTQPKLKSIALNSISVAWEFDVKERRSWLSGAPETNSSLKATAIDEWKYWPVN